MTTYTDDMTAIVNRALQVIGTRTTVTTSEMNSLSSNEAKQIDLIFTAYRDQLLRMAPWNCGVAYANLVYLTSQPGTPENTSPTTALWTPGQPPLGWAYEYFYPDDCLRACFLIPSMITGAAGGVPIFPSPTSVGTVPTVWNGPAIRYKVGVDQYLRQLTTLGLDSGGSGHAVGDVILCGGAPPAGLVPAGCINVIVTAVVAGAVTGITVSPFPNLKKSSLLFHDSTYTLPQVATTGIGTGLVVSYNGVSTPSSGRVILTNQEFATLAYVKQITDPNVMDPDFVEAWANVLGAGVSIPLSGDKGLTNMAVATANRKIADARKNDGNEGLTINDVTPDWIRVRGIDFAGYMNGPWAGFDWGPDWPTA